MRKYYDTQSSCTHIITPCGSMSKRKEERFAWLDWARSFAIFAIIFCHCTEAIYSFDQTPLEVVDINVWFKFIFFTIGRLGVPVFLFLTGALILSRYKFQDFSNVKQFYKRKWLPLLLCYEFWIVFYSLITYFVSSQFDFLYFLQCLLLIRVPYFSHLWYMPMIIGIYLAIPILGFLIFKLGHQFVWGYLALASISIVILPQLQQYIALDLSFCNSLYLYYVLAGYGLFSLLQPQVSQNSMKFWLICVTAIIAISLFVLVVKNQISSHVVGGGFYVWYSYPCLILLAIVLFPLFTVFDRIKSTFISKISVSAFGMYLVHMFNLTIFRDVFNLTSFFECLSLSLPIRVVFLQCVIFGVSFLEVFLIMKFVPKISSKLFLTKLSPQGRN